MTATSPACPDGDIAAAYTGGMSLLGCAAKFGLGEVGVKRALGRAGIPVRRVGQRPSITADGDAVIARRYLAGESADVIAAAVGVHPSVIRRALARTGVKPRTHAESQRWRRDRWGYAGRGDYPWAAEAAAGHQAGKPVGALAREHGVSWATMRRAIERQGITVVPGKRGRPRSRSAGRGTPGDAG